MSFGEQSFAILEPANNVNYGSQDLFSSRDDEIRNLLFEVKDGDAFGDATRKVPHGADRTLGAFAERAASIAVRHQDARELQAGIMAAAIALKITDDPREILPALALLYRASEMIGRNPESEFSAIYHVSGGRVHALIDFLQRTPEDKTIQAMGFMEGDDRKGFRFIRNW